MARDRRSLLRVVHACQKSVQISRRISLPSGGNGDSAAERTIPRQVCANARRARRFAERGLKVPERLRGPMAWWAGGRWCRARTVHQRLAGSVSRTLVY